MAETQRTVDDFNNATTGLFDTNTSGAIGSQDLRDLVESAKLSRGGLYISSSAATTISVAGTSVLCAGTTTAMGNLNRFTMPQSGRLTYGGAADVVGLAIATVGLQVTSAAGLLSLSIAENGTEQAATIASADAHTADEPVTITTMGLFSLTNGDYLEMFVANEDATNNVTAVTGQLIVLGLFS